MLILQQIRYMPKSVFLFVFVIIFSARSFAQETVERKGKIADSVTEKYFVLRSDEQTKQGLYQALFRKKIAVASGSYNKGKQVGIWHYYDRRGTLVQNFDHSNNTLLYESQPDTSSAIRCLISIDKKLSDTDRMTPPVKIGGNYFGYLPYVTLFKVPFDVFDINTDLLEAEIELVISPMGMLADYKVRIASDVYKYKRTFNMDVKLFKDADRKFLPATFNKQPILSRVIIRCFVTNKGNLEFD